MLSKPDKPMQDLIERAYIHLRSVNMLLEPKSRPIFADLGEVGQRIAGRETNFIGAIELGSCLATIEKAVKKIQEKEPEQKGSETRSNQSINVDELLEKLKIARASVQQVIDQPHNKVAKNIVHIFPILAKIESALESLINLVASKVGNLKPSR